MTKNNYIKKTFLSLIFLSLSVSNANAKDFYYKFSNKDGNVDFNLSTTMHPLKAVVKKFKGHMNIKSKDEKNIDQVEGILEIEANSITTNNSLCDNRMKNETLSVSKFPKITFKVSKIAIISNKISIDNTINLKMLGDLTIREVTKKVEIPVKINVAKDKTSAVVEGNYKVNFNDYNVPDPSILIAKVDPIVDLSFKLKVY